jgi:hypothetical protein
MVVLTRWLIALALTLGGASLTAVRLEAQLASAPELTAAFLFNFVRFTTWPSDALGERDSIVVCVTGDDRVAEWLGEITRNQTVTGHPLSIRTTKPGDPVGGCHVVYGARLDERRIQQLLGEASGLPILTVGDSFKFTQRGAVANFFIDNGRMRFAVNPLAADRVQLRISSKLLSLARILKDAPDDIP